MSAAENRKENRGNSSYLWNVLWILVAMVVVGGSLAWRPSETENLLVGWLRFLFFKIGAMTVDVPALVAGALALVAFLGLLHLMMRGSRRAGGRAWSWRGTLALAGILLLAFVTGTALVGALHSSIWLVTDSARVTSNDDSTESMRGAVDAARLAVARSNAEYRNRQLGLGLITFQDLARGLPPGGTMTPRGELLHGWMGFLLASGCLSYYSDKLDYSVPWNKPPNAATYQCQVHECVNPSLGGPRFDAQGFGLAHVAGNVHALPVVVVDQNSRPLRSGFDAGAHGRSIESFSQQGAQTILLGTVAGEFRPWGHPANLRDPVHGLGTGADQFGGPKAWRGAQFVMRDGSVRFLANDVDPKVLASMAK